MTAAADAPGSLDLCFIVDDAPEAIGAHLRECGVEITEGPVPKTGAQGPMRRITAATPTGTWSRSPAISGPISLVDMHATNETGRFSTDVYAHRLKSAAEATAAAGLAGLVITPGYDLRYLLGSRAQTFDASPHW